MTAKQFLTAGLLALTAGFTAPGPLVLKKKRKSWNN